MNAENHEAAEDGQWMSAGAFARRARLSPKALRLYAGNGVLRPRRLEVDSGYRRYHAGQLRDARWIRLLRRAGMPMRDLTDLLDPACDDRRARLERWWDDVTADFEYRRSIVEHLASVATDGKEEHAMYTTTTRDVPAQTLLTEQAYVQVADLETWIVAAGLRQLEAAAPLGGQIAPSLVNFHGEVSEDSDGPVEVALPVDPEQVEASSVAHRVEPAHREAFVTVTRAQLRYPDILSAYDAVERWISQNGERQSGAPRECYFADPSTGDPDEPVAHVAFPIEA